MDGTEIVDAPTSFIILRDIFAGEEEEEEEEATCFCTAPQV